MGWFTNLKKNSGLRVRTLKAGQRLPAIVLFLVVLLDIYLVSILFQGMGWTSEKVTPPVGKITPALMRLCGNVDNLGPQKIALGEPDRANKRWGLASSQMPDMGLYIKYNKGGAREFSSTNSFYLREYGFSQTSVSRSEMGLGSSKIAQKVDAMMRKDWAHPNVSNVVDALEASAYRIKSLNSEIAGLVKNYDTMLRERSARMTAAASLSPGQADTVLEQIEGLRSSMALEIANWNALVDRFAPYIDVFKGDIAKLYPEIVKQNTRNEKWYAFWVNVAQLLFIVPVMAAAILWHRRNMRSATAEVGTLVSSHIIYVTSIPVLAKIIEMVNYIVPYRLFADLFTWVWNAGLQFVWSYVLIVIGILFIFGLARMVLNHSKKTKAKFYLRCLERNLCPKTGRPLPPGCRYSPYTGEALKVKTEQGEAYRYAPYNSQTGEENSEWDELIK